MPTAYSYIRFSSAEQAHGASLDRQRAMIDQWVSRHPQYTLSAVRFEDLGVSGYSGKHKEHGFGKLLAAIESGAIRAGDCVLIEAIDRAGRLEPLEMFPLLGDIVRAGVSIVTLDDGVMYTKESANSNHLFMLVAKIQQAHQYSETLSRRVKDAYSRKREAAKAGAHTTRRKPLWLDKDNNLIPELVPIIRSIFEDFAAGIGERRVLERVRGKHPLLENLNPSTLKRWARNKAAIGWWSNNHLRLKSGKLPSHIPESEEIPNVYPAVITDELFYRVQKRLASSYKPKSAGKKYLLSGLVVCGVCGSNFGVLKNPKSPNTMVCMNRHRLGKEHGCSNSRSIPYFLLEYIQTITSSEYILKAMKQQQLSTNEKRLIAIEQQLIEENNKVDRLSNVIASLDGDELPALTAKLKESAIKLRELKEEKERIEAVESELDYTDAFDYEDDLKENDNLRLNALLQSVDYKIVCNGDEISVDTEAGLQKYEYKGVSRKDNVYLLDYLNVFVTHRIGVPNGKDFVL